MHDARCEMRDTGPGMRHDLVFVSPIPHPLSRIFSGIPHLVSRIPYLIRLLFFLLALPTPAEAHLVNTGLGPFYDGVSHLFISPEDLLTVVALGLFGGLGGSRSGRIMLFSLTGAWIAGGLAGLAQSREIASQLAVIGSFLIVGALVALDRKPPIGMVIGLAATLGVLHGFLNGTAMVAAKLGATGLIGIASAVFGVTALVAAFVVWLQPAWARIGVRIAGSWIAAVGMLMVGWAVRGWK
ncbi:MAG TPA: HupE/UreJ family protein [Candidatus Binatia bacterium]|nr:HupE/UreJ family protein [Candidatus Binatia bacterium]